MPRSKRQREVTLSSVSKKQREWKEGLIEKVRDAVETYPSVYVFKYKDMKNISFKALRDKLRESSRFFLGSNKVLQVALGREASDEVRENISELSKHVKGARPPTHTHTSSLRTVPRPLPLRRRWPGR